MREVIDERVYAVADKGAKPTSGEVNVVLRDVVQEEIARLDRAEKAPNDALTPYGRYTRACLKQWLAWLDLPELGPMLGDVVRIVEAMEHNFLKNPPPPRKDIAAVLPMHDALLLYRVACGWVGREPKVGQQDTDEAHPYCGQHFGSADHPSLYLCELPDGHEGLHAAPSVQIRQQAEPVRMEMLGGGLMAEIGPLVIGEEIAHQLNAGIEPATGKGVLDWPKTIRVDDLPKPTREECEADAKLHEEIVEKLGRPDPDEVRRALDEQRRHRGHVEPEILAAAGAYLRMCDQAEQERRESERFQREMIAAGEKYKLEQASNAVSKTLSFDAQDWARAFMGLFGHRKDEIDEGLMLAWFANALMRGFDEHVVKTEPERALHEEVARTAEAFCTSRRYEPEMRIQRGLYRALRRLRAHQAGDPLPPSLPWADAQKRPFYDCDHEDCMDDAVQHRCAAHGAPSDEEKVDVVVECEATDEKGDRFCHHAAEVQLCHYHGWVAPIAADSTVTLAADMARLNAYVSSEAPERFRGIRTGRNVVDVVIEALRASGEQREGVLLEAKPAQDPQTTRLMVAASMLGSLIGRFEHPNSVDPGRRTGEARDALAWADSLIAEAEESFKPGPGRWA